MEWFWHVIIFVLAAFFGLLGNYMQDKKSQLHPVVAVLLMFVFFEAIFWLQAWACYAGITCEF
jgi:hypothetical protein